ncbi:hypothetical protein NUKP32_31960 [Klebsiella variicola]|nr:hypothetical protein NUKP32_31960 [Klebsiella variicola]
MKHLTEKQIEVLTCVHKGQKPHAMWHQSLDALQRNGLITKTVVGYSITANGIETINRYRQCH